MRAMCEASNAREVEAWSLHIMSHTGRAWCVPRTSTWCGDDRGMSPGDG